MSTQYANGKIVTSGLVLALDAADRNSYRSGSTVWNDVSGNGNSGTLVNGPTFSNNSLVFDGTNDYVSIINSAILKPSIPLTICIIVNITTISDSYIFTNDAGSTNYSGVSIGGSGYIRFGDNTGSGPSSRRDHAFNISANRWNFITVVCNSVINPLIYLNGESTNITSTSGTATTLGYSSANIEIGRRNQASLYFNGNISTCQIYNRALSATEVLQNYNAQKSRFGL